MAYRGSCWVINAISVLINGLKSKNIECKLHKTVVNPVVTYGAEKLVTYKSAVETLMTFERKVLRKIV
jgi:hypothetical protein